MLRVIGVVAFVVAVSAVYEYKDSGAKNIAERIKNMSKKLTDMLNLEKYSPDAELIRDLEKYKSVAGKKSCAMDKTKYDSSFNNLVKGCAGKSAESKRNLDKAISDGLKDTEVEDESITMSKTLIDSASPQGKIALTKAQERLNTVPEKVNKVLQECFHAAKSSINACVKEESKKLRARVIDDLKSIPSGC